MGVALLGDGPAAAAVEAALADGDTTATRVTVDDLDETVPDLVVVVAPTGSDAVGLANDATRANGIPLLTVELGGVGGRPVAGVDAAVAGFGPETGCFDCLRTRVRAHDPETDDGTVAAPTARFAGALAGREAVRLLAGESDLLGHVVELPHARRRFLPVPRCGCGPDPDRHLRRGGEGRSLDAALGAAEAAVDPRVGLVASVAEAESFPVPYYLATLAATPFSDAEVPRHAAGVAADWNPAYMKALGESLERYAGAVYRTREFERGPPGAVAGAVPPAAFVTAPWFPDPDPREDVQWVDGEHLASGDRVRLPAEFVVFPPPEARHRPAITTGLGLGNSGTEALLSGLYEVVERDAAMLAWYSTYDPLGLAVEAEGYRALERRLRAEDLEATALLLTQDVDVPVVAVCVHRPLDDPTAGEWPRFAAGMAASLDPADAALGALEEAVQNLLELRGMGQQRAVSEEGAIGVYGDFPEAAREFVDPATTVPASTVGPETVPDGTAELELLVDRVVDAGLSPYAARLTTRDLAELGFEAVRVVAPTAQPLFTGEAYFGDRAASVPAALGFEARPDRDHHPFP
ncbi:YcaO-like family protein [Salinirubellus salinus]|uniref:YcaO-like family protein n=1 Tax=Salinirubellus salinus TaxID=1364945 RepID=A0A9E7R5S6_9EURY|nr:YcaO-like family protein [Salinirubellus salinus]UWM56127.1 YcaO-like family protein [Salinirubellus salinus]